MISAYGHNLSPAERLLPAINLGTVGKPSWFSPNHLTLLPYRPYRKLLPETLTDVMLSAASKAPLNHQTWIESILQGGDVLHASIVAGEDPPHYTLVRSLHADLNLVTDRA